MKRILSILLISIICVAHAHDEPHKPQEKRKVALVTGITGQDGALLAKFLLELKDYHYIVHGVKRRASSFNTARIDHLYRDLHDSGEKRFILHYGDVSDSTNMIRLIQEIQPDEIYNLAAQSHVRVSFELPNYTAQVDGIGVLNIVEAVRILGLTQKTKVYQASTSEMYGKVQEVPQSETTPFYPRSPYGVAKLYGFWIIKNYREAYNMFACNGILFNHESPIRGETFVTRKIIRAAVRIKYGLQETLYLGNLDAKRDWGHARDYVRAMWMMLQQDEPDDFVIATGQTRSVRDFVEIAFEKVGIDIEWRGSGLDEVGYNKNTNQPVVKVDPKYFRPSEVELLIGDATKAKNVLGWEPKISFEQLVEDMVQHDEKIVKQQVAAIHR